MATKVKYCSHCRKETVHKLVGHKSFAEGLGLGRIIMAIGSLGISETVAADWYYECKKCGEITSD